MRGFDFSGLHKGKSMGGDNEEAGGDSCDHMLCDWRGLTSGAVGDVSIVQPPNVAWTFLVNYGWKLQVTWTIMYLFHFAVLQVNHRQAFNCCIWFSLFY